MAATMIFPQVPWSGSSAEPLTSLPGVWPRNNESEGYVTTEGKPVATRSAWAPRVQSVLRAVASLMFILGGTMKLFAFPAGIPLGGGTAQLLSHVGLGGILEVFGGAPHLVGLFTLPLAFLPTGDMAAAYVQFHAPQGLWPAMNGCVEDVLYSFVWLFFSAAGPGPWSLDAKRPGLRQGFRVAYTRTKWLRSGGA